MYYYFFDRYFGHDRVAQGDLEWIEPWDLFEMRWMWYVLCLWDQISWSEQYAKYTFPATSEIFLLAKWCLSRFSLLHVHEFVVHRFCTYKKAIGLRIRDPEELVKRMPTEKKRKKILSDRKNEQKNLSSATRSNWISFALYIQEVLWRDSSQQLLLVFPDIWTIYQTFSASRISHKRVLLTHAKMTKKQQVEAFWWVATWEKRVIISTPSQIFFDRYRLSEIVVIDQHKWYYKQPQDPRYHSVAVGKRLADIYGCHFAATWFLLDSVALN